MGVASCWKVAASDYPVSVLVSVGEVGGRFEGGRFEELVIGTVFLQKLIHTKICHLKREARV